MGKTNSFGFNGNGSTTPSGTTPVNKKTITSNLVVGSNDIAHNVGQEAIDVTFILSNGKKANYSWENKNINTITVTAVPTLANNVKINIEF
ncbi:MAG: hypothetical protein WCT85_01525 [Parachlamydiales bacterium]|jgi:hypothetical protein